MRAPLSSLRLSLSVAILVTSGFAGVGLEAGTVAPMAGSPDAESDEQSEKPDRLLGPNVMVEYLTPAFPSNRPPDEKDKERFRASGREEPVREILQPTLDAALPPYQRRRDVELSGNVKGTSSDTMPGQVKAWIEAFTKLYPNVKIDLLPPYAGSTGARDLVKGKADFVFVARELKPEDYTDFRAAFGYDPLVVPVSGASYRHFGFTDAHVFFVNKANPLERISFGQLDAMFSSTRHRGGKPITRWGQLGLTGEWADKVIHLYGIKPWNGFEEYPRQRILSHNGQRGEWRDDITFDPLVFLNPRRVAEDRYGIGYCGLSDVDAAVRILALGESDGGPFHAPTYENVARASYPLSRLLYFAANKASGKPLDPILEEFLRFILSKHGQEVVLEHAVYLPLRSEQANDARAAMTGARVNSRFFLTVPYNLGSSAR